MRQDMGHGADSPAVATDTVRITPAPRWRIDAVLLLVLLAALLPRLYLATREPYIHDEENTSIPLSKAISFDPDNLHLPLRGENHGALPAYFVKASGAIFGTSPLGYRAVHIFAGLCTVIVIFLLTRYWYGPVAARWAAAFFAFNEYYLAVSSRATAQVPHLFLVALALYAFSRFLRVQRAVYLYAAGLSVGLAFYCKEHSAFLLPVFFATLLHARFRHWFRSPHVYLACVMFLLIIGPDIYWNVTTDRETARIDYGIRDAGYSTYSSHFERIGGIGVSVYPSMFYARSTVQSLYVSITGRELTDGTREYHAMNPALGVMLLGAVLIATFRPTARHDFRRFLLIMFWGIFGFFTLVAKGNAQGTLDSVSWIWVEATMIPAVILAGASLADARGKWRVLAWAFSGGVLLYACAWMLNVVAE